jgi:hypothetical protein
MQGWTDWAVSWGIIALLWCFVLFFHAFESRNIEEMYMLVAVVMWLCSNYIWMYGEVVNNDDDQLGPPSGHLFIAALSYLGLYHLLLRPLNIIKPDPKTTARFDSLGLKCRFTYFTNWRQYENAQ